EAASSHTVTVQVTDSGGQTYTETFSIALTNVNEAEEMPDFQDVSGSIESSQPVATDGDRPTRSSSMDELSEKDDGIIFPEDTRKMVEIRTEGPPTVQPMSPETTGLKFVHEEFHSKPAPPGDETALASAPIEGSENEGRDKAEGHRDSVALVSEPLDAQQSERVNESAVGVAMTIGLTGLLLQGSGGAKEKLVAATRRSRVYPEGDLTDIESQQSSNDDDSSPPHEPGQEAPTSHTPTST
ncbi:MAG: hypothetical protein HP477_17970, partial [Nitrospira sp.]|nr:hypothetical protein [Nitrospira sp.]